MLNYILLITLLILTYVYIYTKVRHGIHILQLDYYKSKRYYKWLTNNLNVVFSLRDLMLFIGFIIMLINFRSGLIINILMLILLLMGRNIFANKKPLVITNRVKRLLVLIFVIFLLLFSLVIIKYQFLIISYLLVIFAYYLVILVNEINQPLEKYIQNGFVKKALKKLHQNSNLKVIGITGSYGKTSTKYILDTILSQKYNVLKTPGSYNTKMGVVKTINDNLKATDQIFICEMGADEVDNIKTLCDIVKPTIGIVTAIGPQHLETFGSLENVKKAKFELVKAISLKGHVILNYDDENISNINIKRPIISYGLDKKFAYYATDIKMTEFGSSFVIHMAKQKSIKVETELLGKYNILNILGAVAIAKILDVPDCDIKRGISLLKPVEHRLELKRIGDGTIIIDDAYNSNIKGAKMALDVLKMFQGKQKIIITPGLVELGDKTYEYNQNFGQQIASSCNYAILVGHKFTKPIFDGLKMQNFKTENIMIVDSLKEALVKVKEIKNNDKIILLENDLPDNYL